MRICATEFIWGARSRVMTTHSGCAASWRLYFGRGTTDDDLGRSKPSAIYLFIERNFSSNILQTLFICHYLAVHSGGRIITCTYIKWPTQWLIPHYQTYAHARDARTISALGAARTKRYKNGIIVGSAVESKSPDDSN